MSDVYQMEAPPVQAEESRNPFGWIAMGIMIFMMMAMVWASSAAKKPNRLAGYDDDEMMLKRVMSTRSLQKSVGTMLGNSADTNETALLDSLKEPISSLVVEADKNPKAAMLYAEMRTVRKEPVPPEHLVILKNSKYPEDRAFAEIYASEKLTKDQATKLTTGFPKGQFVFTAARVQALEKAGDKDAALRLISTRTAMGLGIITAAAFPFFAISFVIWMGISRRLKDGSLKPLGIPLATLTLPDADRLAVRASQILFTFLLLQFVVGGIVVGFKLPLTDGEAGAIAGLLTIVAVFVLQKLKIAGKGILLSTMGVSTKTLGRDIVIGIMGFIAEFPIAMMLAVFSAVLLRVLPQGTHPATEELLKHHDVRTVLPILIAGSIVAPFWEEIVFRGLLFPGLTRIFGAIGPGMLMSSLVFACAHSQGITLWLPLAFVGAASCTLGQYTRSLVPGMVMHCLHNTTIFIVVLLS